jgi:hypothetical protein
MKISPIKPLPDYPSANEPQLLRVFKEDVWALNKPKAGSLRFSVKKMIRSLQMDTLHLVHVERGLKVF